MAKVKVMLESGKVVTLYSEAFRETEVAMDLITRAFLTDLDIEQIQTAIKIVEGYQS